MKKLSFILGLAVMFLLQGCIIYRHGPRWHRDEHGWHHDPR